MTEKERLFLQKRKVLIKAKFTEFVLNRQDLRLLLGLTKS